MGELDLVSGLTCAGSSDSWMARAAVCALRGPARSLLPQGSLCRLQAFYLWPFHRLLHFVTWFCFYVSHVIWLTKLWHLERAIYLGRGGVFCSLPALVSDSRTGRVAAQRWRDRARTPSELSTQLLRQR